MSDAEEHRAGPSSKWLAQAERGGDADVPCAGCTACCRSSYFIHIEPDEIRTIARIPRALQFPAPGRPKGHVVLGYDENGHCPMLVDDRCSIYDDRPRTCRRYDCRVFAAAGLSPDDDGKPLVAVRVRQWRLDDDEELASVRAAAAFLRAHPECFPEDTAPRQESELAIAAIRVRAAFADGEPDVDTVRQLLLGPGR